MEKHLTRGNKNQQYKLPYQWVKNSGQKKLEQYIFDTP